MRLFLAILLLSPLVANCKAELDPQDEASCDDGSDRCKDDSFNSGEEKTGENNEENLGNNQRTNATSSQGSGDDSDDSPIQDADGDGYADEVDQCNGSDDALIGTRYKDDDGDGLVVASPETDLCPDDPTYVFSQSDVSADQINFPDDDDSSAETDFEGNITTEQELGEDFDGDAITNETYNIYIISNPVQWLGFAGACSFGSNYACSYNVMIIADLDFSVRDGTSGDKTTGDGRYTSTSIHRVLAGDVFSSSYYFRGLIDGRGHSIENFDIDLSAEAGVDKGCGTNTVCDRISGVVGVCYGCKLKNLSFSGNVSGGANVGGMVGYISQPTTLSSLSFSGNLSATGEKVGGLVGETLGSVIMTDHAVSGSISSTSGNSIGGIVGYAYRGLQVKRSHNTASVTGAADEVGGIVGYLADDPGEDSIITESYNTGNVSGSSMVGGIAGEVRHGSTVTDNYNLGTVTSSQNYTGGVVGYLIVGTAHRNYNVGQVLNTNSNSGEGVIGSISSSSSNNNYYLSGRTDSDGDGDVDGADTDTDGGSPAATATSVANLKKEATFSNFEFGTCSNGAYLTKNDCEANSSTWTQVWGISENSSYPYLYNNKQTPPPGS